jgi:hypothetical protein
MISTSLVVKGPITFAGLWGKAEDQDPPALEEFDKEFVALQNSSKYDEALLMLARLAEH